MYGSFIQNIVNFLIIAASIFFMVRLVTKASEKAAELVKKEKGKAEEAPAPEEPKAPTEAELLLQIRDLLAEKAEKTGEETNE